ncbi:metal ABC transporter permease [Phycisphaera mikurensis]|uniref:Iron ABC transporter permease protein n=1 Tax=Phycisphaera mikurensis (strain NBRC 102666 / KCTC 22515 / FYK2301M01) TaxID=1142394 RepID=I0IJ14_PHYMF|nr:metal ABC transporter permease [Phycisphaera mikurensis]MBB6443099.1 ABC-type Mn2+/Zn2+ transport system permease subunit [Phycisphaera mikurensis]BAM05252.1 iron ABC transporter permease protein [Phycisphaera mikurensis NBRC 102666]
MIEPLLVPFQYDYMVRAMLVSGVIGLVCGLLSCFVTLKGWSLMGDALAHAIVPGVAITYFAGLPFALGAFVSGLLAAMVMALVKSRTPIREDAVIGIVFTTFFAAGVLLISVFPSNISLKTIVFGNILGIADGDVVQMLLISAVTLAVIGLKWKDLLLFCFDPNQARAIGLNPAVLHLTLLTLLAGTAVAALQAVGACLVVAMLVTPGATAYLLTDRFPRMMLLACLTGTLTSVVGAYASYFLNGSTGGCIVCLQTAVFLLVLFLAPKHGVRAGRRRGRDTADALLASGDAAPVLATTSTAERA